MKKTKETIRKEYANASRHSNSYETRGSFNFSNTSDFEKFNWERTLLNQRWNELKTERSSWITRWMDISKFVVPEYGRYFVTDTNRGYDKNYAIYDNTATKAVEDLAAGMMAGATSPARPWFDLTVKDKSLLRNQDVKIWLSQVVGSIQDVFHKSNTYDALHRMYMELIAFGTAPNLVMPDPESLIWNYPQTCGTYCVSTNYKGQVNTLYREFQKTVAQVVREFGYDNCSVNVKNLFDRGSLDVWIPIIHCIEPREDRDLTNPNNKNMAYRSTYFEEGDESTGRFLRDSGFKKFQGVCPRWSLLADNIYGTSPVMTCLGDVKQLQHEQLVKGKVLNYKADPPKQVDISMKNKMMNTLPGQTTYVPNMANNAIRTAFEVNMDISHLLLDMQEVRERIRSSLYVDLFRMLADIKTSRMTATEVAERHEEKLIMLGPVIERAQNELQAPMINMVFDRLVETGKVPPPPLALQNQELEIEYVSVLAQAQRAVGTASIDRFTNSLGFVAQLKPEVLDKFNADEWVDIYSDQLGVDPNLIIGNDKVAMLRKARNDAENAMQQAQLAQQQSETTRNLAQSPVEANNALGLMQQFTGYNA